MNSQPTTVREVMTTEVVTIGANDSIGAALERMRAGGFRRLPVIEDGRLVGIITDRDLRLATNSPLVLREKWYSDFILESVKVKSCMTPDPVTIAPEAPLVEAAALMRAKKYGGLPVVENEALVGIVTVTDLLDHLIRLLENKSTSPQ